MPFIKAIASHGFHVYRFTTWQMEDGQKVYFALNIDPYSIAVQIFPEDKVDPVFVSHTPMEISTYVFYFMKHGGESGSFSSKTYKPSPIPEGLGIPLIITFQHCNESILDKL